LVATSSPEFGCWFWTEFSCWFWFRVCLRLSTQKYNDTEDEEYFAVLTTILSATTAAQYYIMNFFIVPQHTSILGERTWMKKNFFIWCAGADRVDRADSEGAD
jgi:hypothetical protein